jgi:hypothetical protein
MAKGLGRLFAFGAAKETTRGTAQSAANSWFSYDDLTWDEKYNNVTQDQAFGVIEDSTAQFRVKNYTDGVIKLPFVDTSIGLLLLGMFGAQAVSTVATGVYAHTFTVAESAQHQSLTFFLHDPLSGVDYSHANGVVHKLSLDAELKKFIEVSASIRAQKGVSQSAFTPSYSSDNYFLPQYMSFVYATSVSGLSGATPIALKSIKLDIDANIEDQEVLGGVAPADFLNKTFKVSGQIEAIYQNNSDFKTVALATPNVPQALGITITNTDVTIGSASNPTLAITIDQAYFTEYSRPIKIKDLVYQTIKFEGTYNTTNTEMIKLLLTNTKSGTYA